MVQPVWRGATAEEAHLKTYGQMDIPEPVGNPQIEAFYNRLRNDARDITNADSSYNQRKTALKDIAQIINDLKILKMDRTTLELWDRAESVTMHRKRHRADKKSSVLPSSILSTQEVIKALKRPTSSELVDEANELLTYLKDHKEIPKDVCELIMGQRGDIKNALKASRADESLHELWAKISALTKKAKTTSTSIPLTTLRTKTILFHAVTIGEQRPKTWTEWIQGRITKHPNPTTQIAINPTTQIAINPTTQIAINPTTQIAINPTTQIAINPTTQIAINPRPPGRSC
ncbi:hypothetical protein SARC_03980 [Sphaeroforma arctica JP610]|uniref:Uncharacterized protein n=1 Tax=Sphaeroforma arctica JP610 TaxID=667725 RepID=A0A0L0G4I2_9EUKA|nr:hypothetical protein SARC_03980 [Sphaeroforma arctica JP610]KNC83804.1 hypothetical protein SARC_03980 [Sphaeroforma arctica JP610]|eukprot:XP_014157706.1 hypothetical protein SARC_03980 [Sphaeroforma arctica JP610]